MKMNLRIAFRFAVLVSLLILLSQTLEFVVGLQDKFIAFNPYVSLILAIIILIVSYGMALKEKTEELGRITFRQAFLTGLIITIFTCILAVPTQLTFYKYINPDFFETMIHYTVNNSKHTMEAAAMYFNLKSYVVQAVLFHLVCGIIISLVLGWRMRTVR